MRIPMLPFTLFITLLATLARGDVEGQKTPKDFRSASVDIKDGRIMSTSDLRSQLQLTLANKTDRTLWLGVRFTPPSPNVGCYEAKRVEPKQESRFDCAQDSVIADVDYPIAVSVFADSALTDTIETGPTQMRFSKKDVAAHGEWMEAKRLPKSYEDIVLRENFGLGTRLFGSVGVSAGTLVVKPDGIDHITKKRTISITAAQIRRVSERQLRDRNDVWLVVDYDDGGTGKILAFQPSGVIGSSSRNLMKASLESLAERREQKD